MALTDNRIGVFQFVSLKGEPEPPQQAVMIDDRPGVDGSEKVLMGVKGVPFSLVSGVDVASYAQGEATVKLYKELVALDAAVLVKGGIDYDGVGFRVLVNHVTKLSCRPITSASGNQINPPSLAWLECRWDLQAVPFEV